MNGFERIVNTIRKESTKATGGEKSINRMRIGTMQTSKSCMIEGFNEVFDENDLLILESSKEWIKDRQWVQDGLKDNLKQGDNVLLYKYDDETYIILGKLVNL